MLSHLTLMHESLRRFAGARFDSRIVDVLIDVLDTGTGSGE